MIVSQLNTKLPNSRCHPCLHNSFWRLTLNPQSNVLRSYTSKHRFETAADRYRFYMSRTTDRETFTEKKLFTQGALFVSLFLCRAEVSSLVLTCSRSHCVQHELLHVAATQSAVGKAFFRVIGLHFLYWCTPPSLSDSLCFSFRRVNIKLNPRAVSKTLSVKETCLRRFISRNCWLKTIPGN